MAVRTLSVWDGVPEAGALKSKLIVARDPHMPLELRQQAISYLTGATKVIGGIEKRQALAEYLRRELSKIKATLYTSGEPHAQHR